ncbi:MAG: 3-deoxy-D-manno-octulosonic acid transferase [Gallionellales bacterium RIFCSPLOWO2_12_FULL_59_22]|nr:MAG: 3-deoxy-D-manno-octulosonic acid transferase [Gallionellales bacterium RIFCSPLOWO2_02_FULL_59_110]OGT12089.1 MAG: 3-deoxy-D-manno-octulosonic acid transferase [Gallionellales bacterium RIFCSPLOWO2_12_FULL_59_22]
MLNPRFFYTLALWLLLPYIFLRLLWRARKQPEYLHHIGERFGFYSAQSDKPIIWLHTVSVGETRAAQSLVERLRTTYPDHRILLTHTTPTGRAASEQLYGDDVLRAYLPYDYPFAVNRFLRHFRPRLGILMETEIWFNLIHACDENNVPLLLLNARLSEKSARGYARFARLTRDALGELAAVAAQTADDAARLSSLGAKNVAVTGNLKFDIAPPPALLDLGRRWRERFGAARKVFLAASTRDGEEALLLDALQQVHIPGLLLVIVPRHPQRFAEVAALLERRGIAFRRRSELGQDGVIAPEIGVVLGDSMGEMFAYYAAADLAFVGGSLVPCGGQNLIEACAAGAPVLIGPHTYNFADATRLAVEAGAAIQVQDGGELAAELQRLLDNTDALHEMQRRCAGFVEANRGATARSLQIVASLAKN